MDEVVSMCDGTPNENCNVVERVVANTKMVGVRDYLCWRSLPQLSQVVISVGEAYRSCHLTFNMCNYTGLSLLEKLTAVVPGGYLL